MYAMNTQTSQNKKKSTYDGDILVCKINTLSKKRNAFLLGLKPVQNSCDAVVQLKAKSTAGSGH